MLVFSGINDFINDRCIGAFFGNLKNEITVEGKPMIEALNTFAYAKDRNARREDEMEKYKRTH